MFRTRDFVLVLTAVAFLVLAITFTASNRLSAPATNSEFVAMQPPEITEVTAVVQETETQTPTREERLDNLRDKIAASSLVTIAEPEHTESDATTELVEEESPGSLTGPMLCSQYNPLYTPNWPVADIQMVEREGVRLYVTATDETSASATTSTSTSLRVSETTHLQLPMQFVPLSEPSCLSSNVVGVALDGSLIRNSEVSLYGVFSSETMIGYALDGFPIYGVGTAETDECGGRIALGQYRYELSDDRDVILNCFGGLPQNFQ